jgi:hypothetical protein
MWKNYGKKSTIVVEKCVERGRESFSERGGGTNNIFGSKYRRQIFFFYTEISLPIGPDQE